MNILITDQSKYKKKSFYKISTYEKINAIITDFDKPQDIKYLSDDAWRNVRR